MEEQTTPSVSGGGYYTLKVTEEVSVLPEAIDYLGHIITPDGLAVAPKHIVDQELSQSYQQE